METSASEFTCQFCKYFVRHYVRHNSGKYTAIDFGHCFRPRIKSRKVNTPACEHFRARAGETAADA